MGKNTHKIAVIGAGIMGLSAAHALQSRGHAVTVYDAAKTNTPNASAKAGGMLAPYSEIEHMNGNWIAAGLNGIAQWKIFAQTHDIGFHETGSLLLAHAEDAYILERFKSHLPQNKKNTVSVKNFEPQLAARFEAGVFLGEEAFLNPQKTLGALKQNLAIKTEAATPDDLAKKYDFVFDCRGYGAAEDIKTLRGVKGETAIVRNTELSLSRPVRLMHPRYPLYIVPREDHHFMIGATMIESADESHVSLRSGLELMSALYSLHPSFGEAEIVEMSAGIRPSFADNLPRIARENNIIRCNGLFRHGYLLAPVMAQAAADMIENKKNAYEDLFHENHNQRPDNRIPSAA